MAVQIIREVNADVVKRGSTRAVYAKQHDINSRFLNIRIQEDGKDIVVDPSLKVHLNVERPDKLENIFYGSVNEDGTVQVPLTGWMLELEGTLVCDVSIVSDDPTVAKLTTMQFNIYVEAAVVSDESFEESEEYSVIVDLLNRAENAEKYIDACEQATKECEEVTEECKNLKEIWEQHPTDTENPHRVTIEQIGAAPVGYGYGEVLPQLVTDDDSNGTKFESMLNELLATMKNGEAKQIRWKNYPYLTNNWRIGTLFKGSDKYALLTGDAFNGKDLKKLLDNGTWSDWIPYGASDFAPAGYGLGEYAVEPPTDNWNDATETGFYAAKYNSPEENIWYFGYVINYHNYCAIQKAYKTNIRVGESVTEISAERRGYAENGDGNFTWGEWEWVDPPMIPGVEYRTTERYLGYPVYCYVLDFGTPADGKTMELPNKDNVYGIKLIARTLYTCGTGVTGAYTPGATFGSGSVSLRIVDSTLEGNSSYPVQVIAYYYRPW